MKITKDKMVSIHYTVKTKKGQVLDQSEKDPFSFIFGKGEIIAGLENALKGREKGEIFNVEIPPEEAYGERNMDLQQTVKKTDIDGLEEIEEGMQLQSENEEGETIVATVVSVSDKEVTIDTNHPLAGVSLVFDVEIVQVSTPSESA